MKRVAMPNRVENRSAGKKGGLRYGFSTGTAASAAAIAALRRLATGSCPDAVSVRLPSGDSLLVPVSWSAEEGVFGLASVVKDAGDDPDITNEAEIRARLCFLRPDEAGAGIVLLGGKGVGRVTKPGLPVSPGEPAINPVPRRMIAENLSNELAALEKSGFEPAFADPAGLDQALRLPFQTDEINSSRPGVSILVEIEVPKGKELAARTLNPRLGIVGGISILGTTGIVRPFSNEAYEETIRAALSVAASSGLKTVVLSTGGKSEKFAAGLLPELPPEAFVQIADFFSFAVKEARAFGFSRIVHSLFFGKAVKTAQGHPYTHAHTVPLDLDFLAGVARGLGHDDAHCNELSSANTARHALEIITAEGSYDIVESIARKAARQSAKIAGEGKTIRVLLFDYGGRLLADIE